MPLQNVWQWLKGHFELMAIKKKDNQDEQSASLSPPPPSAWKQNRNCHVKVNPHPPPHCLHESRIETPMWRQTTTPPA